jgi:hypothetical protein
MSIKKGRGIVVSKGDNKSNTCRQRCFHKNGYDPKLYQNCVWFESKQSGNLGPRSKNTFGKQLRRSLHTDSRLSLETSTLPPLTVDTCSEKLAFDLAQGCQMVCFQTKNPKFGYILEGL